jgi:glycerophosphoryl diester phosphodiesterase
MLDWLTARPIAHRGLHDAAAGIIENTPQAFRAAIDGGYGIECDLQISADGEAMVYHDDELGRLTEGEGRLDAMTASALQRVAFKGSSDRMLTLGALCDLVGGRTTLVIELKGHFPGDTRLAARTASVLAGQQGPIAAMSFDPILMAAVRRLAPSLTLGLVAMKRAPDTPTIARMSPFQYVRQMFAARTQFMAYRVQNLVSVPPLLARHVFGWPLLTWTVRTPEDRARAARYADQVIFEGFRP